MQFQEVIVSVDVSRPKLARKTKEALMLGLVSLFSVLCAVFVTWDFNRTGSPRAFALGTWFCLDILLMEAAYFAIYAVRTLTGHTMMGHEIDCNK